MTIPVELSGLATTLADHPEGYLLTASDQGRVKAVMVPVEAVDGVIRVGGSSRGTAANLAVNSAATLLFPPLEHHGYSLLVDGTAAADGDGVVFTPESAVFHRPAAHGDGTGVATDDDCGHDCRPV